MQCPSCQLENPTTAEVCDCGYSFTKRLQTRRNPGDSPELAELRAIARTVKSIRTMALFWTCVMIASAILAAIQFNQFEDRLKDVQKQFGRTELRR